jgi:preprotein translocase subunit SecF
MGFFGIELTMSSFAALLMMLGFSLDTDMLLTMRLIKQRRGTLREAAWSALHTGGTMSVTDLIAFTVLLVVGYFTHLTTYFEIASVAVIGLIGDIIATWMFNAPLIMMMLKEK